jgi:hypothetical protein
VNKERSFSIIGRGATTAAMILILALAAVRLFGTCVERVLPMHSRMELGQLHRSTQALAAASAKLGDAAFFGSSATMFGFDPAVFDATLAERGQHLTTLNFGMIPITPTTDRAFADQLCEAHRAAGTRWQLLIYEIMPQDWNVKPDGSGPNTRSNTFEQAMRAMTIAPAAVAQNPARVADLVVGRALGHYQPFALASAVKKYLFEDLSPTWESKVPDWVVAFRGFADLFRPGYRGDWTSEARGFVRMGSPETERRYEAYVRSQTTEAAFEQQHKDAVADGIPQMTISPVDLARSIALIRDIGSCPAHVVLVLYPINPRIVAAMQPDALQRLHQTLSTIETETGFPIVNLFEAPGFESADFVDGDHLKMMRGTTLFSRTLAMRVAEILSPK